MNRRAYVIGAAAVVVAGVAIGVAMSRTGGSDASGAPAVDFAKLVGLQTSPPPWGSGYQHLNDRLPLLGLSALAAEGTELHIHQHLDVFVDGKRATIPAHIGIQTRVGPKAYITELHTHRPDGILHVESPAKQQFTLGQFFGEWGVRLTSRCLGRYCGTLRWWVNGHLRSGDPAHLLLRPHQEIVVAYGKKPATVPRSFAFPAGY